MDYLKDFEDKMGDESFSDAELLVIARTYIQQLQDNVNKLSSAIETSVKMLDVLI